LNRRSRHAANTGFPFLIEAPNPPASSGSSRASAAAGFCRAAAHSALQATEILSSADWPRLNLDLMWATHCSPGPNIRWHYVSLSQADVLNTILSSPTILTRTIRSASDYFNGAYRKCAGWRSLTLHTYASAADCPYPHARAHALAACTTHLTLALYFHYTWTRSAPFRESFFCPFTLYEVYCANEAHDVGANPGGTTALAT
jgi:hypothetical protein